MTTANTKVRNLKGAIFEIVCLTATLFGVLALIVLLEEILRQGFGSLDIGFLSSFPSRIPEDAGVKSAILGTGWVIGLTALFSFPLGVSAAIYLEEYAPKNRLTWFLNLNIANLAGVPSIIYGILGLALFVRTLGLDRSILSGALTLTLLILPIVIIVSREALRSVPSFVREASYALGATKWQTISQAVFPSALPGILTGTILALSRAIGETAPVIMIGALTFIAFSPESVFDPFTTLPIQIFNWTSRPQEEFRALAAGAIIVLLMTLLGLNALALFLRSRYQKKAQW
ncbi:MAG: phosphate ABC transporter permease PstA [Terriglobia bacterium]